MICNVSLVPYEQKQLVQGAPAPRTLSHFWSPRPHMLSQAALHLNRWLASGQADQVQIPGKHQLETLSKPWSLIPACVFTGEKIIYLTLSCHCVL